MHEQNTQAVVIKEMPPAHANELDESLMTLDVLINKTYLPVLNQFPVVGKEIDRHKALRSVHLDSVKKIVYDKSENNMQKMKNVFAALSHNDASILIILDGKKDATSIYMGMRNESQHTTHINQGIFKKSLHGNFPGLELNPLYYNDVMAISSEIQDTTQCISAVTGVPSLKKEDDSFIQGLEKVIEAMHGEEYFAILIADPITQEGLSSAEQGYQSIYSSLSQLENVQVSLNSSESQAVGKSIGTNISRTLSQTFTINESSSEGTTDTTTVSKCETQSTTKKLGIWKGSLKKTINDNFLGAIFGEEDSSSSSSCTTQSSSHAKTETFTRGSAQSNGTSITQGNQETNSLTATQQQGKAYQWTCKNRFITSQLENINAQLERIQKCKNSGMWNFGAYFLAPKKSTSFIGAGLLSGLLSGDTTGVERRAILHWDINSDHQQSIDNFISIKKYLACFQHPQFDASADLPVEKLSSTTLISTDELAVGMSLPQKSLPGIPVFESVEFGRSVNTYGSTIRESICLGAIQHLGNDYTQQVHLDIDSLTAHTFITGSTGAGKSNVVYSLVHNLWKTHNIPFLIIEPAKGEYKQVFGGYRGVKTYGTNVNFTPLLRINPFSFPHGIHVTEHIDRLIEILNAVWPMYSAMPAFLKAAIEQTYQKSGWNLVTSKNIYGDIFPDFWDLLTVLPELIHNSSYSAEVKSNYTGALVTRVESLTNGYFRSIFSKNELAYEDIFDKPCILDFSRVGSSETKALLMGIVFMKLHEHRLAKASMANIQLQHVTIIEEAHTLLRNTSATQSMEGANLQGKSVEMMANAIAEMRTYGEGFIIADQAPGLLDPSVIRNTNTKIILRLPDLNDRELVGRAANLNMSQIEELARLRTGCAVIYQNDWQEPVLCRVSKFDAIKMRQLVHCMNDDITIDLRDEARFELLNILFRMYQNKTNYQETSDSLEKINVDILNAYFAPLVHQLNKNPNTLLVCNAINVLLNIPDAIEQVSQDCRDDDKIYFYRFIRDIARKVFLAIPQEKCCEYVKKQTMIHIFTTIGKYHESLQQKCNTEMKNINLWVLDINRFLTHEVS